MKKIILSIVFLSIMCFSLNEGILAARTDGLCEKFVRVHVIANSDTPYDQGVKIAVRDYIFEKYNEEFLKFSTKKESLEFLNEHKNEIQDEINSYLGIIGCDYKGICEISNGKFPTKKYDNIFLPEGNYDAFKIVLGRGIGKNFFCVMFPPMCVDNTVTNISVDDITNEKEKEILSGKIVYKLKLFELFK